VPIEALRQGAIDYVLEARLDRLGPAVRRAMREVGQRRLAAESANRMKDEFLAIVSHELRTPLNATLGWSRIMQMGATSEETVARGLATIERNAVAQARLIDDVLDVSRIVTGQLRLEVTEVEVSAFVRSAVDALRPVASTKGVTLVVDVDPRVGRITGDPDRLEQVAGGRLDVSARRRSDGLEIESPTRGSASPPSRSPMCSIASFKRTAPFARPISSLWGWRSCATWWSGTVAAASGGPGQGATLTVDLPVTIRAPR